MKKLVLWLKGAFEGPDGKASHQKLLVLYMTILFTFVTVTIGFTKAEYPDHVYQIIAGVIVGQSAIRAWQSVKNNQIEKNHDEHRELPK